MLDDLLADDALSAVRFRARLLATELVTNSVLHAGLGPEDRLELAVRLFDHHVRVDVIDMGRWRDRQTTTPRPIDASSGSGLLLVGALADRWGVVKNGTTRVWFELDL